MIEPTLLPCKQAALIASLCTPQPSLCKSLRQTLLEHCSSKALNAFAFGMGALAWVRDSKRPAPADGAPAPQGRTVVSGAPAVLPPPAKKPKKLVWKREDAAPSGGAQQAAAAGRQQEQQQGQQQCQQQPAAAQQAAVQQRRDGVRKAEANQPAAAHPAAGEKARAPGNAAPAPDAAGQPRSTAATAAQADVERLRQAILAQEARLRQQEAAAAAAKAAAASSAEVQARQKQERKARLEAGFAAALAAAQKEAAEAAVAAGASALAADAEEVHRVLAARDDYSLLRLAPGAAAAAIRRRYREMAVALHPDKCREPQATEAFQVGGVGRRRWVVAASLQSAALEHATASGAAA